MRARRTFRVGFARNPRPLTSWVRRAARRHTARRNPNHPNSITTSLPERPKLQDFTLFPQLPIELQQIILSIACQQQQAEEHRFRIAPNPPDFQRSIAAAEHAHLRIVHETHDGGRAFVPSMLHACQYTRELSLKVYSLWPCSRSWTYEAMDSQIYVNVEQDIFFFLSNDTEDFWFLSMIMEREFEYSEVDGIARDSFFTHTLSMSKICFSSELWFQLCELSNVWVPGYLSDAKELSIVFCNPHIDPLEAPPPLYKPRSVTGLTVRRCCAEQMLDWAIRENEWAKILFNEPSWKTPRVNFFDLTPKDDDDSDSIGDRAFLIKIMENAAVYDRDTRFIDFFARYI